MWLQQCLIFLCTTFTIRHSNGAGLEGIFRIWQLEKYVHNKAKYLDNVSLDQNYKNNPEIIFRELAHLNEKINIAGDSILENANEILTDLLGNIEVEARREQQIDKLLEYLEVTDSNYRNMMNFQQIFPHNFIPNSLTDFAESLISNDGFSQKNLLGKIHETFNKTNRYIWQTLKQQGCGIGQSTHQTILNFYNMVTLTELKGKALVQIGYSILQIYQRGLFDEEIHTAKKEFNKRRRATLQSIKGYIKQTPNEIWKCDPSKHAKGKTYEEITRLIQGYIQNEVDMSESESCWKTCSYYKLTNSRNKCYNKQNYCERRGCNGKILNCQFIESDMQICPSDPKSNRRYDYIKYESGKQLGTIQTCNSSVQNVEAWWRVVVHCSYCVCLCDEADKDSDRYFNLKSSVSNITENKVVVGVRFVKKNRMIHLQVQEAKLGPFGSIDSGTLRWVPLEDHSITNSHDGIDYYTFNSNNRTIALDDVKIKSNEYVVTGVQFKFIDTKLTIEIRQTKFDFKKGLMRASETEWVASKQNNRNEFKLYKPDIPTKTKYSLPDSKTGQFIQFTNSDLEKDVGQTTVPFIDIQSVQSFQPAPLEGIGIYHKGRTGYGGFIAPRIFTYNIQDFIKYKKGN